MPTALNKKSDHGGLSEELHSHNATIEWKQFSAKTGTTGKTVTTLTSGETGTSGTWGKNDNRCYLTHSRDFGAPLVGKDPQAGYQISNYNEIISL